MATVDAQYWGVPQRRRRIYLIADFGGESAPEILFEREGMPGYFKESISEGQGTAGKAENCIGATVGCDVYNFEITGDIAACLNASSCNSPTHSGPSILEDKSAICIQGSMIGRADENGPQGSGINEDVSFTLNATDRHAVVYGITPYKGTSEEMCINEIDTSLKIDTNGKNPSCHQGGVAVVWHLL